MSQDQSQTIEQIGARIVAAQQEMTDLEKEANALEEEARARRRRRSDLNKEVADLSVVLGHAQVRKHVVDAQAAALAAKTESEATLARLADKEKRLDELLAKAEAKEAAPDQPKA